MCIRDSHHVVIGAQKVITPVLVEGGRSIHSACAAKALRPALGGVFATTYDCLGLFLNGVGKGKVSE